MHLAEKLSINPNYSKLRTMLFNKGIPEPISFKSFIELYMPFTALPKYIHFDSSFQRARRIINNPELYPFIYGNENSRLFAVQYLWNGEQFLTFFLEGIDFRREFVDGLRKYTPEVSEELAWKISNMITHDAYYALSKTNFFDNSRNRAPMDREKVAMQYANTVAWRSYSRPGDDLMDVFNGLTTVFSLNGTKYVDIDDERVSCFVIDSVLYIYQP